MCAMAQAATPDAVMAWLEEYQKIYIVKDGEVPEWFHGIKSRKQAEDLLLTKPLGCFLIRVSESRSGYTLSYKAENRCRHFMIDMLADNQYVIVGEKMYHRSLHDLVNFHHQAPIAPFTELLTVACSQVSKDNINSVADVLLNGQEDIPPALPAHSNMFLSTTPTQNPNPNMTLAISSSSQRLYPSLELEFLALNLHNMGSPPLMSTPKTKSINTAPNGKSLTTGCAERLQASPEPAAEDKAHPKSQAESKHAGMSLAQCKKIFRKKNNHSEQHIHTTTNTDEVKKDGAVMKRRDIQMFNAFKNLTKTSTGTLPVEYHKPPPFAPGY